VITPGPPAVVTFDCYSTLIDSRAGLEAAFASLIQVRGWDADAAELAADWDARNKVLQREARVWTGYTELARQAMSSTAARFRLRGDVRQDTDAVLATIPQWPHYDDVPAGVQAVAGRYPVALLTNIDDRLLAATRTGFPFPRAVTSEQARCYKPHAGIYRYAEAQLGSPLLHVPASARDVRGAMEAGIDVIRVVRPGQALDPDGPTPEASVDDLRDLANLLP
jgi:2-haloacid dehalogenase